MCTLSAVVLDMFLPSRQCWCHPYIISSTLYISYHIKLTEWNLSQECWVVSFQDHINDLQDNLYWWFSLHVTSGHCLHVICICTCHPHIIWAYAYYVHIICSGPWYIPSSQTMLCTCHLYCCYLYMYMLSTYYLGIYVLCAHYLQWSLRCFFLTDNAYVIHTSSLVLFIYPIIYNLVSTHSCVVSFQDHINDLQDNLYW